VSVDWTDEKGFVPLRKPSSPLQKALSEAAEEVDKLNHRGILQIVLLVKPIGIQINCAIGDLRSSSLVSYSDIEKAVVNPILSNILRMSLELQQAAVINPDT
jgi:hypothetical protein